MKEAVYLVKNSSGRELYVCAGSPAQAKRRFCKAWGFKPSDPWLGVSSLSAHKLTPKEREDWEAQAEDMRDLAVFIEGMFEVGVEAMKAARKEGGG